MSRNISDRSHFLHILKIHTKRKKVKIITLGRRVGPDPVLAVFFTEIIIRRSNIKVEVKRMGMTHIATYNPALRLNTGLPCLLKEQLSGELC